MGAIIAPLSIYFIQHPVAPKVNTNKKHIACIGDSITFGNGVWPLQSRLSFSAYLNNYVKDEYQVLNYGMSGRTLLNEGDHPYTRENFYNITHEIKSDVYIIMLGTNDSKAYNWKYAGENGINYKNELKEFATSYLNLDNSPKVYLMQPPKAFNQIGSDKPGFLIDNNVIENEICGLIKEVGGELNVDVIDLYTYTKDHPGWFADGVHPNAKGDKKIAEYIYSIIKETL